MIRYTFCRFNSCLTAVVCFDPPHICRFNSCLRLDCCLFHLPSPSLGRNVTSLGNWGVNLQRGRICSKNFINGCSHDNVISDIMATSINSIFCISRIYLLLSECINLSWDFITEQTEAISQINGRERISLAVYKGFQTADSARFGISAWCHNSSFAIDTKILSGNYFTGSETSIPKAKIKIYSSPTFCHF